MAFCIGIARHLKLHLNLFEKLVLSALLFLATNALLYELLHIAHLHPSIHCLGFFYAIAGLSLWLLSATQQESQGIISLRDYVGIAVGIALFYALMVPVISYPAGTGRSLSALHLMSNGEDNASHFALYKFAYMHHGYAYGASINHSGLINSLINYPQASEFNTAWLTSSVIGSSFANKDTVLLLAYYAACVFFYSLLGGLTTIASLYIYEHRWKQKLDIFSACIAFIAAMGLLFTSPLLQLLGSGFQSQIASYSYLVAMVLALSAGTKAIHNNTRGYTLIILLLFAGICTSWWFLAPVAAAPLVLYAWQAKAKLLRDRLGVIYGVVILALAAYPIMLSILSPIATTSLSANGGVPRIATSTLILYGVALSPMLYLSHKQKNELRDLFVIGAAWLAFTALLALVQLISVGHLSYYYYKSVYTALLLAALALIPLCLHFHRMVSTRTSALGYRLYITATFITVTIVLFVSLKVTYHNTYTSDAFPFPMSYPAEVTLFDARREQKYSDVLFLGNCNLASTYAANRWAGAMYLSENSTRHDFGIATLNNNTPQIRRLLEQTTSRNTVLIANPEHCDERNITAQAKGLGYSHFK